MTKKTSYTELLQDPRWQKRRLERLELAKWQCEKCSNPFETLHVHHKKYVSGRKPWEYSDEELEVLCADCHGGEHDEAGELASKELESKIDAANAALRDARDDEKRIAWAVLGALLKERSPRQIKRMELARGLRR